MLYVDGALLSCTSILVHDINPCWLGGGEVNKKRVEAPWMKKKEKTVGNFLRNGNG